MMLSSSSGWLLAIACHSLLVFGHPSDPRHGKGSDSRPAVTIKQGTVVGKLLDDGTFPEPLEGFMGIPYALPPTNDRRLRPAEPVRKSHETIEALNIGPRCPGYQANPYPEDHLIGPDSESEDCLTINVFRPQSAKGSGKHKKKLPVAVYIPGGAFNRGAARMYNAPSMLAHSPESFVVVSMQYRLGVLGGLNTELTADEGLLNLAIRDIYTSLEWVQENIAAFGGDPKDVTVLGASAGAHAIGYMLMDINQRKRLFHKVVMDNGGPTARTINKPASDLNTQHFREFLDLTPCKQYKNLKDPKILPCLRGLPFETIDKAGKAVFAKSEPGLRWAWQPVIDGKIISRRPIDAWKSGKWNKMPILTGATHNEGAPFVPKATNTSEDFTNVFRQLLPTLSDADMKELESLYPDPSTDPNSPYADPMLPKLGAGLQYRRVEAAYAQHAYYCPVQQTVHLSSSPGPKNPPVFVYHWALNRTVLLGASHADQVPYQTYNPDVRKISAAQEEVSGKLHAYAVSFILKGDPSAVNKGKHGKRPKWMPWSEKKPVTMLFGQGNDERAGGTGTGIAAQFVEYNWGEKQCEFWQKVTERHNA